MPQGDTVFFPMTDYWMGRLVDGRRVEVRARTAHWARLIPGRRFARFQVGNFRGPQLLFMVAAVEVVSRSTLLELAGRASPARLSGDCHRAGGLLSKTRAAGARGARVGSDSLGYIRAAG